MPRLTSYLITNIVKRSKISIMAITLYHNDISAPSRAVWAVLKQIGKEFDLKPLDLLTQEHKADWYLKINPVGQVPFLTDDDFKMPESRAIMCYLIDQYSDKSTHDFLYPADPKARAKVDSLLFWSMSYHNAIVQAIVVPALFGSEQTEENLEKLRTMTKAMNEMYKGHSLNNFSCADILNGYYLTIAFGMGHKVMKSVDYPEVEKFYNAIMENAVFKDVNQGFAGFLADRSSKE